MAKSETGLKFLKDATIAIMSTSALLLTLLLGFIVRNLPPYAKTDVFVGTIGLGLAILFDALLLFWVTARVMSGPKGWLDRGIAILFLVQWMAFGFGLLLIILAIVVILYS